MSLLTTLAYAITAAVRPRVRDAEVAALKAQIDDLRRQLNDARLLLEAPRPPAQQQISREAQTLQAYAMIQQANAQAHQLSMQNGPYIGQQLGQIDMQNFGQALEDYVRNCTPGRHELLTATPQQHS
jgi:flagellar biosynthesis/type III secretory pathway protein FliH